MQTANRAAAAGGIAVNVLVASMTKKPFKDFTPASSAPDSFDLALNEYATFRFGAKKATFLLLLDEAQNILDTPRARSYLSTLHMGMDGVKVALACFGLADTTKRLDELGLSRLASGHVRTLGMLSNDESERTVRKTLERGLAKFTFHYGPFDEDERTKWIGTATNAILEASANFPHHLANGCKALGRILLHDGVLREPPVDRLQEMCSERRREYYDARLESWSNHKTALAYGFGTSGNSCRANVEDVEKALMAVDEYGKPVPPEEASSVVLGLHDKGLIEVKGGECRLVVPSMATYFREIRSDDTKPIVKTLQAALSTSNQQRGVGYGAIR